MRDEICFAAAIKAVNPALYPILVTENQNAVLLLESAGFSVAVASQDGGVMASKEVLMRLGDSIDEDYINRLAIGFKEGVGTAAKDYLRDAIAAAGRKK